MLLAAHVSNLRGDLPAFLPDLRAALGAFANRAPSLEIIVFAASNRRHCAQSCGGLSG
jgi:hypothetical protein